MTCESISATNLYPVSLQGRLASELKISFGNSPAVAHAISETADKIYRFEGNLTTPGTMLYSAVHVSEPAGKPIDMCQRVNVKLTIWKNSDSGIKDMKVKKKEVFKRITQEAYDQSGVLTIEDCERIMLTSIRTLKQYIWEFKEERVYLPLRGYVHSTGRGQTHKNEIICFYLEGMEFKDIQYRTYHSLTAISRYITLFSRIALCYENDHMPIEKIAKIVNASTELVSKYLKIYEKYASQDNERLQLILNPVELDNYILPFKKKRVIA